MHARSLFLILSGLLIFGSNASAQCVNMVEECVGGAIPGPRPCTTAAGALNKAPGAACTPGAGLIATPVCRGSVVSGAFCCGCQAPGTVICIIAPIRNGVKIYLFAGNGLKEIILRNVTNASVSPEPSSLQAGEKEFSFNAIKQDVNAPSRIDVEAFDQTGARTTCDPVLTLVIRETGKPVRQNFPDLPQAEGKVTIFNDTPGIKTLQITANAWTFHMAGLKDREVRTIDVSAAMLPGNRNTITLTGTGKPGGSATVMIHD